LRDVAAEHGTTRLGVETLPQIVTRGVLVDVAGLHGVDTLAAGTVITPDDVTTTLDKAGVTVAAGDAVLFHTGWGRQFGLANQAYLAGEPGPGMALAEWLADCRVAVTGCDTWSYGPVPAEDHDRPFRVPQWLNTRRGVVVIENLRLTELAAAGVVEFMLVASHPKLRGATGAWTAPLALV
jgi:kynurenine formamidase